MDIKYIDKYKKYKLKYQMLKNNLLGGNDNRFEELENLIKSIYDESRVMSDKNGLKHVKTKMQNDVINYMRDNYKEEATEYIKARNENNKNIKNIIERVYKNLQQEIDKLKIKNEKSMEIMSSYPNLNLIMDSDIDIGIMIKNLDDKIYNKIKVLLLRLGFEEGEIYINPVNNTNRYYRFLKNIDKMEFEIKLRDKDDTALMIEMHKKIHENITPKEEKYFTYLKYLMKKKGKPGYYLYTKALIAETFFCDVNGSYMFFKK